MEGCTILLFFSFLLSTLKMPTATDTITMSQSIRDGDTLVSAGGSFELGFFSPGNSMKRYLGIWYKKISTKTFVWVANREIPLNDSSGALMVTNPGILVLLNRSKSIIWSSNSSHPVPNPVAQLLDSGNLVVRDGNDDNPENFLWQSFDCPSDTFLPGMKLGKNLVTGLNRYISSWKSTDDPSQGGFTFRLDPRGFPELIASNDSVETFRIGPWNGLRFSGSPELKENRYYTFNFVYNQEEIYFQYQLLNSSIITRMLVNQNGLVQRFIWVDRTKSWVIYFTFQIDNCDQYALCGPYGSCNINNNPVCGCLKGFIPKFPNDWDMVDWTNGCVRKVQLDCQNGDGFTRYSGLKLPETQHSRYNDSMSLEECRIVCLENCSCTAYTTLDIKRGTGCLLWFGELIDIRVFTENGQDIYIRMAASELDQGDNAKIKATSNVRKRVRIIAISAVSIAVLLLSLVLVFYVWRTKHKSAERMRPTWERQYSHESNEDSGSRHF